MGMNATQCVWPLGAILGEGPIYSAREDAIYFVDIKKPALHRLTLIDGAKATWSMPAPIGWVAERRDSPGFIIGLRNGFAKLTLDPFAVTLIAELESGLPGNRMNDAKADSRGRLWAGTMDDAEVQESGALYRLDSDHSWRRMDDGYRVPNGPTFSPDGDVLYHADSARRTVYRFDLDAAGELSNKSIFTTFLEDSGYPDGMTTDADGGVWIAHWGGARVSRFTPDGVLDRAIALPVTQPTSCVFAGPDLTRMFVTSASIGLADEPLAGALFEIDPGARGLPTHAFAG